MKIETVEHTTCRSCGAHIVPVMNLGEHSLPGWPAVDEPPPGIAPLTVSQCLNHNCGLVQLQHTVPAELLFREYWYRSGTNPAMVAALHDVVEKARARVPVRKTDAVLDIGANDGTLLGAYDAGSATPFRIAVEPSQVETQNCELRLHTYFPCFTEVEHPARIITAIAMFYDLEDPGAFVEGIKKWLHPDGVFVLQVGYLLDMLRSNAFDAICHEHVEYYSLKSLVHLFAQHDLAVEDIETNDVNGGSLRCYVRHAAKAKPTSAVIQLLNVEAVAQLDSPEPLVYFQHRVDKIVAALRDAVQGERAAGRPVDVYGASTKGLTLMQVAGLDSSLIRLAVDRNPEKYGRFYGATGIPIASEDTWRLRDPGLAIVLPWHFKQGILEREAAWRAHGGRFLFPLPEMEVV